MGKLIYAINLTLDGVCDHTKGIPDEELHDYHTQLLRKVEVLLYGRKTYELMVPFWPDVARSKSAPTRQMNDFAQAFVGVNKIVVVSRSLHKVEGSNTGIIRSNLKEEVLKLKQEGGDIIIGGVDVASQLIAFGLVDEYHFVIQPLIVGEGRKVLDVIKLKERLQLKLVASQIFSSGTVALRLVNK